MKIKARKEFYDLQAGKGRKAGEEFEAEETRAAQLIEKGFVSAAGGKAEPASVTDAAPEVPEAVKPKRTRKKA